MNVRVTSIDRGGEPKVVELERYLGSTSFRPSNTMHAETRVFTCRGSRKEHELHWNDAGVPGEVLLGRYGLSVERAIIDRVIAELVKGHAVRLFVFNSDGDVCWQDLIEIAA